RRSVPAQPPYLPVRARRLLEPRAGPDAQAVAPPQGNPSFDWSRRTAGAHPDPARALLQERGGEGGTCSRQGEAAARQARDGARARRSARDGARGQVTVIGALLGAFQIAAATPALVVRDGEHAERVPLVASANG